jgi:HTH-type transcriptional regulator/antitoxin HigA
LSSFHSTEVQQIEAVIDSKAIEEITAPSASPLDMPNFLMTQHNLKQSELPEMGTQGVVSEILRGKRELNIRQIRELSNRFQVPPSVFI